MTTHKQEIEERLQREFEICERHIMRINEAIDGLADIMPLSQVIYDNLNKRLKIKN